MINLGYNNRWLRLVKDLLFVALGCWLVSRGGFFAIMVGIFALAWYGRDAWYQAKALWQEKHFVPKDNNISRPASSEDGKITVSSNAKEVDFEKE